MQFTSLKISQKACSDAIYEFENYRKVCVCETILCAEQMVSQQKTVLSKLFSFEHFSKFSNQYIIFKLWYQFKITSAGALVNKVTQIIYFSHKTSDTTYKFFSTIFTLYVQSMHNAFAIQKKLYYKKSMHLLFRKSSK